MSSNSQKATSSIPAMGMVWMATSESKSMACSKSDDVNVGDPPRSARRAVPANKSKQRERRDGGEEVRRTSLNSENAGTVVRKSDGS
jgi:hypothetical protein